MKRKRIPSLSGILAEGELDFELYFVTDILRLPSLHYGYWEAPPASIGFDLREMRQAQSRYTDRLLELIPPGERLRILDVGAGTGEVARELAKRGHTVHAISPDKNHRRFFAQPKPGLTFEACRFEDFVTHARFDVVLFSESHNYINHEIGLKKSREILKPSGSIVVAGMFRAGDRGRLPDDFSLNEHAYFEIANELEFEIDTCVDVTQNVSPTMEIVHSALRDYIAPLADMGARYLAAISPWKAHVISLLGGRELDRLSTVRRYYMERTNPDYFRSHIRYAMARLQLDPIQESPCVCANGNGLAIVRA